MSHFRALRAESAGRASAAAANARLRATLVSTLQWGLHDVSAALAAKSRPLLAAASGPRAPLGERTPGSVAGSGWAGSDDSDPGRTGPGSVHF